MQEYADADDEAAYVVIGNFPAPRELLLDNGYPRMRAHVMRSCKTTHPGRASTTVPQSRATTAG